MVSVRQPDGENVNTTTKGNNEMRNELINFILNLTPEQVDKIIANLPRIQEAIKAGNANG